MKYFNIFFKDQIIRSENLYLKKNPSADLIFNSAYSILNFIDKEFNKKKFLFFCGTGNNGNDGKRVCNLDSKINFFKLIEVNKNFEISKSLIKQIKECDIIIDAIFGFGLNRKLEKNIEEIILIINRSNKTVISIDIPSGIDADTGKIFNVAVKSDITLALGFFKPCHFLNPGKSYCGRKKLLKLNLPLPPKNEINIKIINKNFIQKSKFKYDIHKYNKGSVLIYGGKMSGASRLSALSARRVGAGLSTINVDEENLKFYGGCEPGTIVSCSKEINFRKINSIVLGPGLGKDYNKKKVINILKQTNLPVVIDADALNIFKNSKKELFDTLKNRKMNILTPHHGEFKNLFGFDGKSKIHDALEAAKVTASIVVYKGNDTVIATPKGDVWININAKNTLATAGTGDILTGLIAGLIAQGRKLVEACITANWILGDMSQNRNNIIAEDFVDQINFYNNCLNNN